jgi:hypothetical protein
MTDNIPVAPEPFHYTPASGVTPGMSDATPRGDYAQRVMPVPAVTTPGVPNVTPGVPVNPSEVVPPASKQ